MTDTSENQAVSPPPKRPGLFARHKLATVLATIILVPVLGFILWVTLTLNYDYSRGDRAGIMQKFSAPGLPAYAIVKPQ